MILRLTLFATSLVCFGVMSALDLYPRLDSEPPKKPWIWLLDFPNAGFSSDHGARIEEHFSKEPSFIRELRQNYIDLAYFRTDDIKGCQQKVSSEALEKSQQFLGQFREHTLRPFKDSTFSGFDPYALRLFVVSSYLGRCEFPLYQDILESLYRNAQSNYYPSKKTKLTFFPNVVAFYDFVGLERYHQREKYLFALRHELLWGYFSQNKNLPSEFHRDFDALQRDLKPKGLSAAGFLGRNETFSAVVESDQRFISRLICSSKKICTAQELGKSLLGVIRAYHKIYPKTLPHYPFIDSESREVRRQIVRYGGMNYEVSHEDRGAEVQISPFLDGLQGVLDYEIRNLSQDQREPVSIAGLVPYLILMHEFFEGRDTSFRVDPVSIANLFVEDPATRERNVTVGQDFEKTYVSR